MVYRDYPLWRMIILPFYSMKELLFVLVFVSFITILIWIIGAPAELYRYTVAGYIGAAFVSYFGTPAHMRRPYDELRSIEGYLKLNGFEFESDEHLWRPIWPKLLLWSHNRVKLDVNEPDLIVSGPYSVLIRMHKLLNCGKLRELELR